MTDDIVTRLRSASTQREWWPRDRLDAADEIERLRERRDDWRTAMAENHDLWNENERLRAALLEISELEPEGPIGNDCMAVSYASETARAALGEVSDDAAS